jgi:hypothetical protein
MSANIKGFNSQAHKDTWWPGIKTGLPDPRNLLEGYGGRYVIFALIAAICIGVILVAVDAFYPFLPVNPLGGPSTTGRQGKTFWKNPGDVENLIVPANQSPTSQPEVYSMTVQIAVSDSRAPSLGNYRHILHRGANPCGLNWTPSGSSGTSGIHIGSLQQTGDVIAYGSNGLPAVMNPGIFLDPYKNDIQIFVHTTKGTTILTESTTIADIPLGQTINLGLICNRKTLEVYVNCRLYTTHLFEGIPYLPVSNNVWYGRYCAFPFLGALQNLTLWNAAIPSADVRLLCPSTTVSNIPDTCAAATGLMTRVSLSGSGL